MGRQKKQQPKNMNKNLKRKNRIKKFFAILLFWLLVLTVLTGIGLGVYYILTTDKLKVENISIENSGYYTNEQILEVANIEKGKNMIFLPRGKIKERILEKLPYIEQVKIKIGQNSTLRLILTERTSRYVVNNKDTNVYVRVDKYGIMLEKVNAEDISSDEMPLFGLSLNENEQVGKCIPNTEYAKIKRFETVYESFLKENFENEVTSVKFENSKIILTLDYKTEVVTKISDNLKYKMKLLKEILKEVAGKGGRIDLTLENPTFVEKIG